MKNVMTALLLCSAMCVHAQNVGIGTSSPNPNAKLDITATDKGVLIPRMDSVHRKAIPNTMGLLVYDSTSNSFWYNDGLAWQNLATSAADINVGGSFTSIGKGAYAGVQNQYPYLNLTAIGISALRKNINDPSQYLSGFNNTAVGGGALQSNTTGLDNTAVGAASLSSTITGQGNTVMGSQAMVFNLGGNNNAAFGKYALYGNKSGSYNTAIGVEAMILNESGSYNTAVGASASQSGNLTNTTAIGANARVDASNKIRLGDYQVTVVESNGVFNTVSDGRFKYNIQEDVKGLDFIMQLRPVTYQFDAKKQADFTKGVIDAIELNSHIIPAAFNENNAIKRTGFIAQEVEKAAQKTGYDFDGVKIPATDKQYYSLSYASFVVPLVKAVQEQQQTIETLKKQNELLQQQNKQAQEQNKMIIERLKTLEKK